MKKIQTNGNLNFVNHKQLFVKQIRANYFRNYKNLELNLSPENVVLFGFNGVGKTSSPALITDEQQEGTIFVLMPMRV